MRAASPPPTPDPYKVAAAQQALNVSTAIASTVLANADEDTPEATTTTTQIGTYSLQDPQYDSNGNLVGTTTRTIPVFKKTITLKTSTQGIFDKQQSLQDALLTMANTQTGGLSSLMETSFTLSGLPAAASSPLAPTLQQSLEAVAAIVDTIDDTEIFAAKQAVIDAINDRLQWQLDIDRSNQVTLLSNQGIFPGSVAYDRAMRVHFHAATDARSQAILAGGQEHTRLFTILVQKAEFKIRAQSQAFTQAVTKITHYNGVLVQQFQLNRAIADFANSFRERTMQENLLIRNQALNEVTSLLHGGNMNLPAMTPYRGASVDSTPLGQYVYNSAALDMEKYKMNVERQNAMIGGIAGAIGSVAAMPLSGGGSIGGLLFR